MSCTFTKAYSKEVIMHLKAMCNYETLKMMMQQLTPSQRQTRSVGGMLACMYTWSDSRKRVSIASEVSLRVFISFTICKELFMSGIWDFNLLR